MRPINTEIKQQVDRKLIERFQNLIDNFHRSKKTYSQK